MLARAPEWDPSDASPRRLSVLQNVRSHREKDDGGGSFGPLTGGSGGCYLSPAVGSADMRALVSNLSFIHRDPCRQSRHESSSILQSPYLLTTSWIGSP